jgi:hypothetical protein
MSTGSGHASGAAVDDEVLPRALARKGGRAVGGGATAGVETAHRALWHKDFDSHRPTLISRRLNDQRIPYSNFSEMRIRIAELAKAAGF